MACPVHAFPGNSLLAAAAAGRHPKGSLPAMASKVVSAMRLDEEVGALGPFFPVLSPASIPTRPFLVGMVIILNPSINMGESLLTSD